ncbi:hypothetical protein OLZ33_20825 [Pantoea ananatis]|uniref:hypothetical protein n=1 Tax=Pantoea ananas TaxID=553 RepID=UPI002222EAE2|nr:hypothetical protein [Pantoea ananatis]MCW1834422.1 hypothetical protein [Pantoea ananatis]
MLSSALDGNNAPDISLSLYPGRLYCMTAQMVAQKVINLRHAQRSVEMTVYLMERDHPRGIVR